ncbi:MAG TPA: ABC transporter ATP-binding protein [Bdellovibrionota bacterium]|jgi:oligopeptide/dipeptide ABC transporter ATP-binding protein|nr:ABC transporter ATP-binding protein [Bdellovibrionota bacterium]
MSQGEPILQVRNLSTSFFTEEGEVRAVDDVSFSVKAGSTLGVVGESGCGKSVTSLSIMRLVPTPPGKIMAGEILYSGRDLLKVSPADMRKIRGDEISMIFQEPMTSLNPVFTIGNQIVEAIRLHQDLSQEAAEAKAVDMLRLVGIPAPEKRIKDYPHQLSGGMRQRVMIAMALSCNPKVLIADEPTTALDVTIQAQILDLLRSLQEKVGLGIILITHDLGVVAEMADEVVVMYAGRVVEHAPVDEIFEKPKHPYTRGLLRSIPSLTPRGPGGARSRLEAIPGIVPNMLELPKGCRFQERCPHVTEECRAAEPVLREISKGHRIRCIKDL